MSFTINRNSANTILPTLKEKTTLPNPTYLWQFKSVASGSLFYCICTELSTYLERYNKFVLTETGATTPVPLNGEVSLSAGDYEYTIYEQASATNLNPSGLTVVEVGDATSYDSTINTNKIYTGANLIDKVYNG